MSFIQQLSQEINKNTELKIMYLEEALVNLDQSNLLTREHIPGVIGQLIQKLQQYIQMNPNDKNMKSIRMVLMASQTLYAQSKMHKK
jgi:enhancer of mRNA-decapping protein 4